MRVNIMYHTDLEDACCSLCVYPCFVHSFLIRFFSLSTVLFLQCFATEQHWEEARQSPVSSSVISVLHPYWGGGKHFGSSKIGCLSSESFDLKVLAFVMCEFLLST